MTIILRLVFSGIAACVLLGCKPVIKSVKAGNIRLMYQVKDNEKVLDLKGSKDWQPQWQDSLVARLERGAYPALDQDNNPLPADSLPRARRFRGVVLIQGADGTLRDGVLRHEPREVRVYMPEQPGPPALDLYFYDQAVSLESFYARVPQSAVERLTGRPLEFVRAQ